MEGNDLYNRDENQRELELAKEDLQLVLSRVEGRRVLYRYLARCKVYQSSFRHDPYESAFVEGERNIGLLMIADMLDANPADYGRMLTENSGK